MRSLVRRVVAAAAVGGLALALSAAGTAADSKSPDVETIMKKVAGKKGLCAACATAGKAANWEDAQKSAKELKELGAALGKNPCPKGDGESWKTLTKKYAEQTTAISTAAEKKDAAALSTAVGAFTKSCKTCHDSHK